MRVLVTGIRGFTGSYLAEELLRAGHDVIGVVRHASSKSLSGVQSVHVCDLTDADSLKAVVASVQPDAVAHLAGISFVSHSDAEAIYRANLIGSRNLLEALLGSGKSLRVVLLASSANVYGNAGVGVLDETTPLAPANDYAVSKLAMEYVARLYLPRLPIVIVRPFNYTGVGQALNFLVPKIVDHFRRRAPVIELGNLDVARDFSDVRTIVSIYRRLMECESAVGQTFNVCSGQALSLRDVLEMARKISGHHIEVRVNPAFVRENEVKVLVGSMKRLESYLGPLPRIPFKETLYWMLTA